MRDRIPPTTMLPSSAQKMKNLVLSQSQGCSTMTLGTMNHSHIGENHVTKPVGIQLRSTCAATNSGMNSDVLRIQNQTNSGTARIAACFCQSRYESHPSSKQ